MSPTKKFLLTITVIYIVVAVLGIALFKSPSYSSAYMARHAEEHARYRVIIAKPEYKLFEERPELNPVPHEMKEELEFAEEYAGAPEFQAEQRRIFRYNMYFKTLNSLVFIALIVRFARKPLLNFFDSQIAQIRANLANAEEAHKNTGSLLTEAKAKMTQWAESEKQIQRDMDQKIEENLGQIRNEFASAQDQLARETEDRKQAELYRASRAVREELVARTIATLEERYRTESTEQRLATNVDQFVKLMDTLS
jgi:F-type H+-transporting ATPase subunit b